MQLSIKSMDVERLSTSSVCWSPKKASPSSSLRSPGALSGGSGARPRRGSVGGDPYDPYGFTSAGVSPADRFIPDRQRAVDASTAHFLLSDGAGGEARHSGPTSPLGRPSSTLSGDDSLPQSPAGSPHRANRSGRHSTAGGPAAGVVKGGPSQGSAAPAPGVQPYSNNLVRTLFPDVPSSVLGLRSPNEATQSTGSGQCDAFSKSHGVVYNENRSRNFQSRTFRVIPQTPERILDAPEMVDDYYLNLLDWSARNILAVALGNTCYLWNADDGSITQLMTTSERENAITSVAWHPDGTLAVGCSNGHVQLWDAESLRLVRTIAGHQARVCSMSWSGNLLASGSRDTRILLHDARDPTLSGAVQGHMQEVCGLKWSPNGSQLASGGNDNTVNIWDLRRASLEVTPLWQFAEHTAAVKALAWNPAKPTVLCTGGGTADRTLRFWDSMTGTCLNAIDTQSQVCGVLWNDDGTELISSHGYTDNQLTLWRYPSLKRVADLTGHTSRVLHLAKSPDGQTIVSAAADETIRFWRCFAPPHATRTSGLGIGGGLSAAPSSASAGHGGRTSGTASPPRHASQHGRGSTQGLFSALHEDGFGMSLR